jgi:hypothetical protein
MKRRTPLKRTRKTPRGQSRNMQKEYRESNPDCEWAYQFPGIETYIGRPVDMRQWMKPQCHHIFGRSNGDNWSGLITLSKYAHDWAHANGVAGDILCMLVKFRKREVDLVFWQKASGKQIVTWIESLSVYYQLGDWLYPYCKELVAELKTIVEQRTGLPGA